MPKFALTTIGESLLRLSTASGYPLETARRLDLTIVRAELESLVNLGCKEITVDEPSMSCYAYREDTKRFVDIFNRTVAPVVGKTHLSTH